MQTGFEAPVMLAYSARNRSASIRIPYVSCRRIEIPDPTANPYLAFSAMLMAGVDGIQNKIHPGEAASKDLYDLPEEEALAIPTVASSLEQALDALDADRAFLTAGGVFTDDMIDGYMELKREEVERLNMTTHPVEFGMYYKVKAMTEASLRHYNTMYLALLNSLNNGIMVLDANGKSVGLTNQRANSRD